jgi:hypothetical protein
MCKFEEMFKESANRKLALKHALWKGDLWLADDLINDNYFSALTARADLEAERYAMHTKCTAYKDKRQSASSNGSSVIADLTYSVAKHEKTRSDFYSKSGGSSSSSTSSSGSTGGGGSWAGSGWSLPTVTGPAALTYGQHFFPSEFPHTNDPPNRSNFTGTAGGTQAIQQTTGVTPRTRADRRRGRPIVVEDPILPGPTPQNTTTLATSGGRGRRKDRRRQVFSGGTEGSRGGTGGTTQTTTPTTVTAGV